MKRLVLVLALVSLAAPTALARRTRVVHHPAESCSFQLVPVWGTAAVPAAGQTRGIVFIYGQTANCAQWNGYSPVDWVTVEAAPMDAQPAAYVTVAPNLGAEARSTTLIIAGIRLDLTQEGAPTLTSPNLVTNGSFNTSIDGWIWYTGRFPNGSGTVSWSLLDANGSPSSGSISVRDNGSNLALQRLQCLVVNKDTRYRFGTKVRTSAPKERGDGTIALFLYRTPDCTGEFVESETRLLSPAQPNVWQDYSFTMRTGSRTQSMILIIASGAVIHPFETLFDDVFVEPEQ
ncbi:MAG TPA: BACON domain-containing carbohydrate-binding protein [Thermoanaerobaculia bacterium]